MITYLLATIISTRVHVYHLTYTSPDGRVTTTETYTRHNSCNSRAQALKSQNFNIIEWCIYK